MDNQKLIFPDVKYNLLWKCVGFMLAILTLTISLWVCYDLFFDRENHIQRKALEKWLNENNLPECQRFQKWKIWYINEYELTLSEECFYIFDGSNLILSSFNYSFFEKQRYNRILKKLRLISKREL